MLAATMSCAHEPFMIWLELNGMLKRD
jgi:hypothetical protein